MFDSLRFTRHKTKVLAERLGRGGDPYQPLPAVSSKITSPTLEAEGMASAEPITAFLTDVGNEISLLAEYGNRMRSEFDWYLHYLMRITRPDSLISSLKRITSSQALILPSLSLAISPPSRWMAHSLSGSKVRVTGVADFEQTLPAVLEECIPGDPLGLVSSTQGATVSLQLSSEVTARLLFVPCYPVVDAELIVGSNRYLPMKTRRGLYFWLESVTGDAFSLSLASGTVLLGCPLLADGDWESPGEVRCSISHVLTPTTVKGTASGASVFVRDRNIPTWVEATLGRSVMPKIASQTMIAVPDATGKIALPAGQMPTQILRGHRCWQVETGTVDGGGILQVENTTYLPLEATALTVTNGKAVRLRAYLSTDQGTTLQADLPGTITVSGVAQTGRSSGGLRQIQLPAGESELSILLTASGAARFYVPIPANMGMRARYITPAYELSANGISMVNSPQIPHLITLVSRDRITMDARVSLPVVQGRPSVIADLQIG